MINTPTRGQMDAVLRNNFLAFCLRAFSVFHNGQTLDATWVHQAMAHQLSLCFGGTLQRLIINAPPRTLKSMMTSVFLPAFILGHDPTKKIIVICYGQDLAVNLARLFRRLVHDPFFRRVFPWVEAARDTDQLFETTRGGFRLATSIGAALTGLAADLMIIDDPLKAGEADDEAPRDAANDFITSSALSRLDNPATGAVILVMQRLHENDATGYLSERGTWNRLTLRAIAIENEDFDLGNGHIYSRKKGELLLPNHLNASVLQGLKRALGHKFDPMYQQDLQPSGGNFVRRASLAYYLSVAREPDDLIVMSWDTALKPGDTNDYSVCTVWLLRGKFSYLLSVFRQRLTFPELVATAASLHGQYKPDSILIEDHGSGTSLIQELNARYRIGAIPCRPRGDKQERLRSVLPYFEHREVLFQEGASYLPDLERELLGFPSAKFDDQVDSLSQYLNWLQQRPRTMKFEADFGWGPTGSAYFPF